MDGEPGCRDAPAGDTGGVLTAPGWRAFVDDTGVLSLDQQREFRGWLKKFCGQEVIVSVRRRPKRQSPQQLRYYRGVVVPDIADACGYSDPDDFQAVHEGLAWKFLRLPDGPFGEPRRRSTSPTDMAMDELARYIDQVITYAETSIPGCRIRRPEDVDLDSIVDPNWR